MGLEHDGLPLARHQPGRQKEELHDQARHGHRNVRGDQEEQRHAPAVVLAIDVEDRQDNQVREDERDDAPETDAAVPQHGGQRYVADRAYKGKHRDDGSDDGTPDRGDDRMLHQEERLPEPFRHPGGQRARDEQAAGDVPPDGRPVHDEVVADRGEAPPREDSLQQRPFGDRHVHLRVPFHGAHETTLGLPASLLDEPGPQERSEEQRQDHDHEQAAQELRRRERPAQEQDHDDGQLRDQVRRGEFEGDGAREIGALSEHRARQGDGGVGA